MTHPDPSHLPDKESLRLEALLRRTLEAPCSAERVWQRILASQGLGPSAVESAPAAFRFSSRRLFWGAAVAAVLALAVGVGFYLAGGRGRGPLPGGYPGPVVQGPLTVVGGGTVRRGAEVTTAGLPAWLSLGNYCQLEIAPYSRLRLVGDDRDEAVVLQAGRITCDVDRGVGRFEVRTDVGTVTVHGTKFSTAVEDESNPMDLLQGVERMFTRRLVVTVFTGMVAVSGTWGSTALAGGQSREFVKDAPSTQPGVTGGWTDFEIANQKYYRAYLDRRVLPVAVARVMLPEPQQAQARKILDESATAWARYQDACRDELKQIERKTQDLWTKAGQDPTVKAAYSEWELLSRKLRDLPEEKRTAEQKQALQEARQRTQKTYEATADSRAAMQSRMKYWETEIKGMDIAPTLQKLETVLTAGQMATLNKRLEQMRALDDRTEAGGKWRKTYPCYGDVATAITDMDLEKDVAEKALAEVKAAEGRYREYLDSQREQLDRLRPVNATQEECQRLWDAAAKLRAAGRDVPGTIRKVGAVLSSEQAAELGQRVTRMEQARAAR